MAVQAVVFDIGGVLEINQDMGLATRWAAQLGLSPAELDTKLDDIWAAGAIGTITEDMVHRAISDRLGITRERADSMMDVMWVQYLGIGNTELIEYARRLRTRYRTGILSNSFVGARRREQEKYRFADLVDELVYSHEVGMLKPDTRIYELTCTRLGVSPDEMIFVDDVLENVAAARDFGIHAVHYRDNAQAIQRIDEILGMERPAGDRVTHA